MSKKRRKSFKTQSQITEKYLESFLQTKSGDTIEEKADEVVEGNLAATNAGVPQNRTDTSVKAKHINVLRLAWTVIGVLVLLFAFIGGIWQIGRYFWNLENRVSNTSGRVDKIEIALNDFSVETKEWHKNIVNSVAELRNKLNALIKHWSKEKSIGK